ncbi:MAG: rhodanese-like domain-containing protein [Flavobacterium sp.]|nr:rhodanese-like domain-containing protein [Pedobacter sp.]
MKKVSYLFVFLILSGTTLSAQSKYYTVKASKAEKVIKKNNLIVLDVRTPEEVNEGAMTDAINYDFKAPGFKDQISSLPKKVPYFIYCRSGNRSAKAIEMMKSLGFTRIYHLEGGYLAYDEWKKQLGK